MASERESVRRSRRRGGERAEATIDYVIKEMVNVAALQPWSYGCTWEVAKHERSVKVARGDSRV